jgi:uncharacterized protein YuzE
MTRPERTATFPRGIEVTFVGDRPLAAYVTLRPALPGGVHRSEEICDGIVVDYAADGRALGVEIYLPGAVTRDRLNAVLADLGAAALSEDEFSPLAV